MLAYFLAFAISLPFLMEASRNYKKYKYRPYVKADSNQTGLKQINPYEDRRNYKLKYLFFFLMAFLPPFSFLQFAMEWVQITFLLMSRDLTAY